MTTRKFLNAAFSCILLAITQRAASAPPASATLCGVWRWPVKTLSGWRRPPGRSYLSTTKTTKLATRARKRFTNPNARTLRCTDGSVQGLAAPRSWLRVSTASATGSPPKRLRRLSIRRFRLRITRAGNKISSRASPIQKPMIGSSTARSGVNSTPSQPTMISKSSLFWMVSMLPRYETCQVRRATKSILHGKPHETHPLRARLSQWRRRNRPQQG